MRILAAPVLAALASGSAVVVQLVQMAFSTVPVALNMSTWDLVWNSVTYKGAYGLGTISAVVDKPGDVQGITLEMSGGDAARISLALDDSDIVQGTPLTLRTAIMDPATYTILDAPADWVGTLDTMVIVEDGQQASIRVTAESNAVDLLRGTPQFYNDTDQRAINANDGSFRFVVDQIDKPLIWPAKSFFYQ